MFNTNYRRYVLIALTSVYGLNLVDRQLMILLLQPIKEDLRLSDTQLGFLTGIAFGVFYALVGVPLARRADRGNRVTITSLAIGLWGLTVMGSVFVGNFFQLLLARIAAAVGESGCKPPTYSLIGDYFPDPVERTRAMSIFWLGSPISALASFIIGGWLNERYGWRMTFFLVGIPGLLLAALIRATIVEPRERTKAPESLPNARPPMTRVLMTVWQQRSFRHLSIALVLLYTTSLGLAPWYAAFMIRSHGMRPAELGVWFGFIFGLSGIAGILLGGFVSARWFAHDEARQVRVSAASMLLLVPCFVIFLLVREKAQALAALVPLMVVFNFFLAPTYALMQRLVPDSMRATTLALVMLLANLIGMGLGPQLVGILSDWLAPTWGRDSLRYAMLVMSFGGAWAACHFWLVSRTVKGDLTRVDAQSPLSELRPPLVPPEQVGRWR